MTSEAASAPAHYTTHDAGAELHNFITISCCKSFTDQKLWQHSDGGTVEVKFNAGHQMMKSEGHKDCTLFQIDTAAKLLQELSVFFLILVIFFQYHTNVYRGFIIKITMLHI